jgi:hypothetical protein
MTTFEIITGRDTCNGSCETEAGCCCNAKTLPARREKLPPSDVTCGVTAILAGAVGSMLLILALAIGARWVL